MTKADAASSTLRPESPNFSFTVISWKITYHSGIGYTGHGDYAVAIYEAFAKEYHWKVQASDMTEQECADLDGGIGKWDVKGAPGYNAGKNWVTNGCEFVLSALYGR